MHGAFPFGRPNTERPPRRPTGPTHVLVVGVYPSAFHVRWWHPDATTARPTISALAVDVEPVVFWDGTTPSPTDLLERWVDDVNFTERFGRVAPGMNGPSGRGLIAEYLEPLGVDDTTTAYTDLIPWFFIKGGRRSQGDAIDKRFRPWAHKSGAHECTLPARPTPSQLVGLVSATGRRDTLRAEILDIGPDVILTLGQEALDGLGVVCDTFAPSQRTLAPDQTYGAPGEVTIDGVPFEVIATVHPGLLRQVQDGPWTTAHRRWTMTARHV